MKQNLLFTNKIKSLVAAVISSVFLLGMQSVAQTVTNNTQGTHDGFFYSFWNDGQSGSASMTLGPEGNYTTTWNNINNFTAGKGWQTGRADRTICFEGSYDGGNNGFLAVYGWTKDPLIEYYVVEDYGDWTPPGNTSDIISQGSFTCDGGTYDIFVSTRTNKPSIVGTATFQQYWSVRRTRRSTGTVTFENHIAKWQELGMDMGTTWDYQIMESEGYQSTGSSDITVWECVSCNAEAPTVVPTVFYEQGDEAGPLTATGTNLNWYTSASSTTPLTSAPTPSTETTGTTSYFVSQTPGDCESSRSEIKVTVNNIYKVFKVNNPIIIDGNIDAMWNDANVMPMDATKLVNGAVSAPADLSGFGKILWDDDYLYVFASVTDDAKVNDSDDIYNDDNVEFYIDADNSKGSEYDANDVQYSFRWNDGTNVGFLPEGRSVAGIEYTVEETADGYFVEGRIPWTTIQNTPASGDLIGLDFMINDDDDEGERDGKLSWNADEDQAWQNPSLFGIGKLMDNVIITSVIEMEETSITVYPNPTEGSLSINGFTDSFEYTLIDNTNRTIQRGESHKEIDFSGVESGLYNLMITQGDFKKTIKIIIAD